MGLKAAIVGWWLIVFIHKTVACLYSLESRAKNVDALLRELKNNVLRIWVPLIAGAAVLIGLFAGMGIQNWRDSAPVEVATPPPITGQTAPSLQSGRNDGRIKA